MRELNQNPMLLQGSYMWNEIFIVLNVPFYKYLFIFKIANIFEKLNWFILKALEKKKFASQDTDMGFYCSCRGVLSRDNGI